MRTFLALLLISACLISTGCYRATIDTGAEPSAKKIETPWAHGWVFGLVAPKTIEAEEQCTKGVAKVETQLSFVNQLVSFFTLNIYTPMQITVTCTA